MEGSTKRYTVCENYNKNRVPLTFMVTKSNNYVQNV